MREWMVHGGRLSEARQHYPDTREAWIDLSTGINPHAWPGAADVAIDWTRLPDEAALDSLERAAADHFGVDPGLVCALPGTEMGIRLLGNLALPGRAFHVFPSYRTHAEALPGSIPVDAAALATLGAGSETILLANPNNPDGRIVPPTDLVRLAERLSAAGGWIVIDEAFADAVPDASVAGHVGDGLPLIVLRSFGKFFGLAGVRLGFAIGPWAMVDRFRGMLGSWPVSAAGIAIGTAAYRDAAWIAATRTRLATDAAALDAVLARHGHRAVGACPLFRLIEVDDAAPLFDRLARQAILTRPFDYAPRWLRLGLPADEAALDRLDRALGRG